MNTESLPNGVRHHDVDQLLRTFFRREMPDPWPQAKVPPQPVQRPWLRILGPRLAVAAAIALILVGYLALGSFFEPKNRPALNLNPGGDIGSRPSLKKPALPHGSEPTPLQPDVTSKGDKVELRGMKLPDGVIIMDLKNTQR